MALGATKHWRERIVGTPLHDLLGVWMVVWSYAPILAGIWAFHRWPSVPVYVLAVLVGGARMNALFVTSHDTYHSTVFRSRAVNAWVGAIVSYSVAMPYFHNRQVHWDHHRHVGTSRDPDAPAWDWPEHHRWRFVREMLWLGSGWSYVDRIGRIVLGLERPTGEGVRKTKPPLAGELKKQEIPRIVAAQLLVLALFALTVGARWYLLLWVVPALSVFPAWATLREMLEHRRGALIVYRAGLVERFLLGSFNFHLHAYHHAHASAPWFTLPIMRAKAHSKVDDIVYLDSYFGELWAYLRGRSVVPSRKLDSAGATEDGAVLAEDPDHDGGEPG
jgi:fatty acid desaturase